MKIKLKPFHRLLRSYCITQTEFGKLIGRSRRSAAYWILHYENIKIKHLRALKNATGKTTAQIITDLEKFEDES